MPESVNHPLLGQTSKKTSKKKLNKSSCPPVSSIIGEIQELRKQLVSIKSKRELSNALQPRLEKQPPPPKSVQLSLITNIRSRETKLKLNVQINKIKGLLEQLSKNNSISSIIETLSAQINLLLAHTDNKLHQYEQLYLSQKQSSDHLHAALAQKSTKLIKTKQEKHFQKEQALSYFEEIEQLKRTLCFHLEVNKGARQEAVRCEKQYENLDAYVRELQINNQLLRKQIAENKLQKEKCEIEGEKNKERERGMALEIAMCKQDAHARQLEIEKYKSVNKQIKEQVQNARQEISASHSSNTKLNETVLQLQKQIQSLQNLLQINNENLARITASSQPQQLQNKKLTLQLQSLKNNNRQQLKAIQQYEALIQNLQQKVTGLSAQNVQYKETVEYCKEQIECLAKQVDQLREANQKYKNKYFRDKIREGEGQARSKGAGGINNRKSPKKLALMEIQELINKHKGEDDDEDDSIC